MSDSDNAELEEIAKRLRSSADTPQAKKFAEQVIALAARSTAYYMALGQFVSHFSRVETTLQHALWVAAGVDAKIGPAIFGGVKVEGCLQFIKRIADAKGWEASQ